MRWLVLSVSLLWGQQVLRQRVYGGAMADVLVRAYADAAGYWLFGHTRSRDGLLKRKGYDADFWVLRLDRSGEVVWHATYGAEGDEELADGLVLPDGGLVLVGWTDSPSLTHGRKDAYIVCTDPLGRVRWSRAIGGTGNDAAQGVGLHADNTLWVVGQIGSRDSVFHPEPFGGIDGWLLRLSLEGELVGHAVFGGAENDYLRLVIPLSPDTVWLVGASDSRDGHIQSPLGKMDIWVVETDRAGQWRRSWNLGGTDFEEPYSWVRSPTGEVWVAGTSFSRGVAAYGRADGAIWRLSLEGAAHAPWSGGGTGDEGLNFLSLSPEGDWLIAGMTSSRNGLIPQLAGLYDAWALRWNPATDSLIFCYTFGGKDMDSWVALFPAEGGAYLGLGTTASPGDQLGVRTYGSADIWAVWWTPDTVPFALPPPEAPTILLGYIQTEKPGTSAWVFFRDAAGNPIDSVETGEAGFFLWRLPDTLTGEVRMSLHAPGHLWKEISVRPRRGRENRVDVRLEKLRPGLRMPLFYVHFDKGSAKLLPDSYPQLQELARFLRANPNLKLELAGHTDGTSRAESEIQLSRARASAVRDYLVAQGIPKERFNIVGYGKAYPIADNATAEGQRRNRRVEFRLLN